MGFAIITARLSDVYGRLLVELGSFALFAGFSLGCALSQSMLQLIIFRAFQGIGGSGLYSLSMTVAMESLPPQQRGAISGIMSTLMAVTGVMGPLVGGALTANSNHSDWRWIFYLNLPISAVAMVLLLVAWPRRPTMPRPARKGWPSVDFLGSILLLAASVLLVFALQEAGNYSFSWDNATIIATLVVAAISFVAFVIWQQWLVAHPQLPVKPVFPVQVAGDRVLGSALLVTLLSGFTYYLAVVNIPEQSEIVDGVSPVTAGVRLLPMMLASAVGAIAGGAISSKRNNTAYTLITSAASQVLGYGLMTTIHASAGSVAPKIYGFQVFLGLGFGMSISSATQMTQLPAEPRWIAATQGALAQLRTLGGSIGLAAAVIVFNRKVRASASLKGALSPSQRSDLYKSPLVISSLKPEQRRLVAGVFADAFTDQMRLALYIAAACFLVSLFTLQSHPPQPVQSRPSGRRQVVDRSEEQARSELRKASTQTE